MNSSTSRWWVDFAILTCAFLLIAHAFDTPSNPDPALSEYGATAGTGTLGRQIGTILLFFYGVIACLVNRKRTFSFNTWSAAMGTALFVLITLSLAWSIDLSASAARWFGFVTYIFAGAGAVKRLGRENLIRWFAFAQFSYLLLGLINEIVRGAFHPFASGYRLWGISNPNTTGNDAVVLIFASVAMLRLSPSSWVYRLTITTAVFILFLSRSRTALFSAIFALLIVYGVVYLRSFKLALYLYGVVIFVSLPFVLDTLNVFNLSEAISLGRQGVTQEKMMGRIPLWTELYQEYIAKRPMLGYGYGAFWTQDRIVDITSDQGWDVAAAHSIYLDAVLAIGFCGGALYVGTMLGLLTNFLKTARRGKQEGFFFACVLCAVLFDGFADSGPWYISSIYTFVSIQALFVFSSLEYETAVPRLAAPVPSSPITLHRGDHLIADS